MAGLDKFGDIQLYAELSQGAMTTTYKGLQKSFDRFVLLKILDPKYSKDAAIAARFEKEAQRVAKVKHPNIISVYAAGQEKDKTYISTEFVDGITVAELIAKGPVPAKVASYVLIETANALKAAHDKQILHRDIRPSNILISKEGQIKVADFGLASAVSASEKENLAVRSTLGYLAPEQILGKKPAESTDLFSLGVILFEMLLGMPAFKGGTSEELLDNVLKHDPASYLLDDETMPSQLRRICQQMIKKKAEQRYQDCSVLLADLNAFRKSRGQGSVATAGDMRSYLDDPEAFIRKLRDKPVSLRTREVRIRSDDQQDVRDRKTTPAPKTTFNFNKSKVLTIAAVVILAFGGLSFASDFFFSKDGSFGANNNPNGSASASSSGGGAAAAARKSGTAGGKATPVRSDRKTPPPAGNQPDTQQNKPPPASEDVQEITIIDEDPLARLIEKADSFAAASNLEVVADTVVLVGDSNRPVGKMIIDALPWAAVYLAGDSLGVTPLPIVVSAGTYKITLKNPDFPSFETLVDVVPGRETPFKISLWSIVGTVQLQVLPFAEVFVNGEYYGKTPFDKPLNVRPGSHQLTLKHPTLGSFEQAFDVKAGENKTLQYNLNNKK
ncbi:MAG: protein kinase [Rhodothermales bacterium]